jgi:hypothetical protein
MVGDPNFKKKRMKFFILTTLICLHGEYFSIKESFN